MRQRPSYGVWKTGENGARKGHAEQEAKPSMSALMSWPAVISPSISALCPPLAVASQWEIAIPRYHMFLLLQILHPVLFKLLQHQGELRISGNRRVVFWWARYGNRRLSFLSRSNLPFVRNNFFAIYFRPIRCPVLKSIHGKQPTMEVVVIFHPFDRLILCYQH